MTARFRIGNLIIVALEAMFLGYFAPELRAFDQDALVIFQVSGRKGIDSCHVFQQRERRDLTPAHKIYYGLDHKGAQGAVADVLATLVILDAQVSQYDLPQTIDRLHEHCTDPKALDPSGMFGELEVSHSGIDDERILPC